MHYSNVSHYVLNLHYLHCNIRDNLSSHLVIGNLFCFEVLNTLFYYLQCNETEETP